MPNMKRHVTHPTSSSPEAGLVEGQTAEALDPDVAAEQTRVCVILLPTTCLHASRLQLQASGHLLLQRMLPFQLITAAVSCLSVC